MENLIFIVSVLLVINGLLLRFSVNSTAEPHPLDSNNPSPIAPDSPDSYRDRDQVPDRDWTINENSIKGVLPNGLQGHSDLEQTKTSARVQNKPTLIDFTVQGGVNFREPEIRVWSYPDVLNILNEDYVVGQQYIEGKTELLEPEWYVSEYDGKPKKTIRNQNADFQTVGESGLINTEGENLIEPKAYDMDIHNFVASLFRIRLKSV